jgi:hypothetical protein
MNDGPIPKHCSFLTTAIVVGAVSVSPKNAIAPVGIVLISVQRDWQASSLQRSYSDPPVWLMSR